MSDPNRFPPYQRPPSYQRRYGEEEEDDDYNPYEETPARERLLSSMDNNNNNNNNDPAYNRRPTSRNYGRDSRYGDYDLPPPVTQSHSNSPSRLSNDSRGGYFSRPQNRPYTASLLSSTDDWNHRPPPSPSTAYERPYDEDLRPETASSSRSGYTVASSRRPLPRAPNGGKKVHDKVQFNDHTTPINSPDYLEEDDLSHYIRDDDASKHDPSVAGDTEYHDHPDENEKTIAVTAGENFGPAPQGPQARRGLNREAVMTKKQVKLINGELILECKIPTILYSFLPRRDDQEFTHMRYTAVTCDPDDFVAKGFTLRQQLGNRRETELFICVTMYNENEILFTRTMHGVMRNIAHFCSRSKSRVWGKDGWQKIVVCIVADGRKKVNPRVLDALAAMGVYQNGIAKNLINGRPVKAHVYEYTTQVSLDADLKFKGAEKGIVPVQMIFCLKENNSKKLNSHRWFFNAFGASLNPNICCLLDVGTKPGYNSLYYLWKAFDMDSQVAGACGEIKAMKGKGWLGLLNPLVASQNFEYKMSNILDKPLESVFGYITVLPGAFSAYRYHALQNDPTGHGPLSQYFKGETMHGKGADIFSANMYLAEDRILCWELVAKRNERWVLKYVRSAYGETDVPDTVPEFVSQRRRWLNGALFAALYSLIHFRQVWDTDHSIIRKILLHIEFLYQFVNLFFTYFSLANFYLTFYFIAGSLSDKRIDPFGNGWGGRIFTVLRVMCVLLICTQFILSMGNRPQGAKRMFMWSMILLFIIMAYNTFSALYVIISSLAGTTKVTEFTKIAIGDNIFTNLVVSTASTVGVYFLMSILYFDPWHMFTSSLQYFMMLPSYICTLQVYAFCNTHDVSWGTKGDNTANTDLGAAVGSKGDTVELEMPSEQLDIDSGYDDALRNLRDRLEVPVEPISDATLNEDYYRAFRTYMVVIWMVANAILIMAITEIYQIDEVGTNFYLKFLLWSVAAISVFRAIGSGAYLVIEAIHWVIEGNVKVSLDWRERFQPEWRRVLKKKTRGGGSGV